MLYTKAGYEVRYISGTGRTGNPHRWIYVKFDDGWFYIDPIYTDGYKMTADYIKAYGCTWDEASLPK